MPYFSLFIDSSGILLICIFLPVAIVIAQQQITVNVSRLVICRCGYNKRFCSIVTTDYEAVYKAHIQVLLDTFLCT